MPTARGNVPLLELAGIKYDKAPLSIYHEEKSRMVYVEAESFQRDLNSIVKDIESEVDEKMALPPGYSIRFGGETEDMRKSFGDLKMAMLMAVALVYMIMAAQFEGLLYPFIILLTLPLMIIGVVISLILTGRSLSLPGFLGLIMLAGIVVNNGIVMVDYINTLRSRGMSRREAILEAGPVRLTPILMTSLTTILGMFPQALGIMEGSETQAIMATVVMGGLSAATFLTLVIEPILYEWLDELREKISMIRGKNNNFSQ